MNKWLAARNILAVRLDNIGDVMMLGPALRAVKETLPQARLTLLASPAGATAAPLLPWIDDTIVWRPVWQDVNRRIPFDPAGERALINLLAERAFDAALIFTSFSQTPHVPGYVCYLARIPLRAGDHYVVKISATKPQEYSLMKRSPQLDQYERFIGNDLLSHIYQAAEHLAGLHVLHINTTAHGFLVDDTEMCAKVTLRLIDDRDLWHELGKQAHIHVKNNYLLTTMVSYYLNALKRALERRAGEA